MGLAPRKGWIAALICIGGYIPMCTFLGIDSQWGLHLSRSAQDWAGRMLEQTHLWDISRPLFSIAIYDFLENSYISSSQFTSQGMRWPLVAHMCGENIRLLSIYTEKSTKGIKKLMFPAPKSLAPLGFRLKLMVLALAECIGAITQCPVHHLKILLII